MSFDRYDSPAELSTVVDALATAIVVLDEQLNVIHLNPAAETLMGISLARARGHNTAELFPGNPEYEASLRQVWHDGVPVTRRELGINISNDRSRIVDCRVSVMESGSGRDLLVELLDAEPRLRINREIALLTQQSVSRNITRQLAHEIKNPLGGLRGAAQLLSRKLDDPELRDYTQVIVDESDRVASLVDSMQGPPQPLSLEPVNVHQQLHRVYELLRGEAPAGIQLVEDYDPSLPELPLDAAAITQVFLNIGRNAVQILGNSGRLCLRSRAETQYVLRGERRALVARIDFEDDGPGVAEEVRDSLFYPLITARPGGTGLGLAVAQELVNRHGGLVQLRRARSPTIFSIYLPA